MKTISLEVDDNSYWDMMNFLRLLPKDRFHLLEDDSDSLSPEEQTQIKALQACLQAGDDSDFEDWEAIKTDFK